MTGRGHRGRQIAQDDGAVKRMNRHRWSVLASDGRRRYTVIDWRDEVNRFTCDCYDHRVRKYRCKHIRAVELFLVRDEFGIDLIQESD